MLAKLDAVGNDSEVRLLVAELPAEQGLDVPAADDPPHDLA